jgi:predicted Zn-dependent peptidase
MGEKPVIYTPAVTLRRKAIEQNHVILAFPAMGYRDPRRYQMLLLNTILGGGVSSRLFQQLREQRGLCYSVYSYCADHAETGLLGIYTALNKEQEAKALEAIRHEVCDLAEHGPTQEELERTREQAKANVLMGLESVQARMSHLGTSTLLYGQVREADQILQEYDRVTQEDLRVLSGEIFDFDRASLSAVGRGGSAEEYAKLLSISL